MKILVQGYLGKYSSMGQWVVDGLIHLGHDVTGIDRFDKVSSKGYDLHFLVDSSEDYSSCIDTDSDAIRVCWLMDTHMPGGLERSLALASKCDYVFSTNKEHGQALLAIHGVQAHLVTITHNDLYIPNKPKEKDLDVVMIGHPNSAERVKLWEILKKYNSFCGIAETKEEFVDYMSRSKIIINQPTEPWDNILNNRFFEALGYNCLLLQKKLQTTLIEDMGFKHGKDFIYWSNLDQLVPMIDSVLDGYKDYDGMRESGNKKVQEYAFTKQLAKIIDIVNEN